MHLKKMWGCTSFMFKNNFLEGNSSLHRVPLRMLEIKSFFGIGQSSLWTLCNSSIASSKEI